jgi:hypothetical protein
MNGKGKGKLQKFVWEKAMSLGSTRNILKKPGTCDTLKTEYSAPSVVAGGAKPLRKDMEK